LMIRTEVLDINPLYGADNYAGQFSKPTCALLGQASGCTVKSDSTSYNLADFIFGLPSSIGLGNNMVTNLRQHVHALYFQDDWRVNSKLTVNLGLRYEFATPQYERDNHMANFDPSTNSTSILGFSHLRLVVRDPRGHSMTHYTAGLSAAMALVAPSNPVRFRGTSG